LSPRSPLRTHYDNLHVTRDAPAEVVRAAYQALASKLHPDRNPDDPQAESAMKLVNAAYEVLADPVRRAQHDRWIRQMEAQAPFVPQPDTALLRPAMSAGENGPASEDPVAFDAAATQSDRPRNTRGRHGWAIASLVSIGALLGAALIGGAVWLMESETRSSRALSATTDALTATTDATTDAARTAAAASVPNASPSRGKDFARPERAPGGEPWPAQSAYLSGFKKLFNDGQSTVTLDNSANPSDVYAKLYAHREARPFAVRWILVKARDVFVVGELRAGRYEVRYRDLDNGVVTRSEPFELREGSVAEGTRFTAARIPLQKVAPREGQSLFDPDF
jgi:curved DNA-binding protein CbpA